LAHQGDLLAAEAEFRAELRSNPTYARAHMSLGEALREQGDFDRAEAEFRDLIQDLRRGGRSATDPPPDRIDASGVTHAIIEERLEISEVYTSLADLLVEQGGAQRADEVCREAVEVSPASPRACY